MQTALEELHRAIYSTLTSHAPLMQKITSVKDGVDETDGFPYVNIGEPTVNPWDTKNTVGENIVMVLHIWSDYPGKLEVYEIMNLIYNALSTPLSLDGGFYGFDVRRESQNVFTDIDGQKRHGVMNFRFFINN